ncbi:MAG: sigma-54-dependent Fis family transcriptional regulator [Bryobacterales bacterium]|nr:sigma-54-dependent Fis family transcriptional regulator [Bryobacterales bacterium]
MYRESSCAAPARSAEVALIGLSPAIRELRGKIDRIASNQSPVLILGETGTGKEVVARKVHERSGLKKFVPIDCSVLVGPLMESELFGYMRGAFTGADANRTGLLEEAHLGTAFFDEIGELPLSLQAKLLRVLQEKEFRPVGSTVSRYVESRVVAATNRNLSEEVRRGRFRQDLFFRLNVITLRIPPLRERPEDIPVLAAYFLDKHAGGLRFSPPVEEALLRYDWPGNVRELENTIHRMSAVSTGRDLGVQDLPSSVLHTVFPPRREAAMPSGASSPDLAPEFRNEGILPLAEVERHAILNALTVTRGDRTTAAQLLGIGRTTLYRKLKSYGVTGDV